VNPDQWALNLTGLKFSDPIFLSTKFCAITTGSGNEPQIPPENLLSVHHSIVSDRNEPSIISELRKEIGAAKTSADATKAAADEAQACADVVQTTASDAKSAVVEDVPGVVDSESIKRDLQCIKYELKKLKSREVLEVVSSFDPSILQELRDEIAAAKPRADKAKATADEGKNESADVKDAASDAERDGTSAQDAASDAKNTVDSV
jgi:hypothetical protein